MFVEQKDQSKAYRLLNFATNKITITRGIIVDEKSGISQSNSDLISYETCLFKNEKTTKVQGKQLHEEKSLRISVHGAQEDQEADLIPKWEKDGAYQRIEHKVGYEMLNFNPI